MEKIDRLGWAAGVSFYAYGLRIGVRVSSAGVPYYTEVFARLK